MTEPTTTPTSDAPERDPDPRKWTREQIIDGLNSLAIPECTLHIHRADRHNPASDVQALTLVVEGMLSFEAITQIAGLFETPHIEFEAKYEISDDAPKMYEMSEPDQVLGYVEPRLQILVRWEARPSVSKVPPENTLPYACPIDGSVPACILPPDGKTARQILDDVRASMHWPRGCRSSCGGKRAPSVSKVPPENAVPATDDNDPTAGLGR